MSARTPAVGPSPRSFVPFLILSVVCPYVTYRLLQRYDPGMSQTDALLVSGVFPALANVLSIVRSRSLDIIGSMVLLGIVIGALGAALGGGPRVILVRESFVTGAAAIVCLVSLGAPRPLFFYIGRDFATGHDPVRIAEFDALWQIPAAQHVFRVLTAVWGIGWLVEVGLKVLIVFSLPIPQALVVGPLESGAFTIVLVLWTLRYTRAARRRGEARRAAAAGGSAPLSP